MSAFDCTLKQRLVSYAIMFEKYACCQIDLLLVFLLYVVCRACDVATSRLGLHCAVKIIAGQLSDMMGTDLTKVSNFVRQFCRPYLLIFC